MPASRARRPQNFSTLHLTWACVSSLRKAWKGAPAAASTQLSQMSTSTFEWEKEGDARNVPCVAGSPVTRPPGSSNFSPRYGCPFPQGICAERRQSTVMELCESIR